MCVLIGASNTYLLTYLPTSLLFYGACPFSLLFQHCSHPTISPPVRRTAIQLVIDHGKAAVQVAAGAQVEGA